MNDRRRFLAGLAALIGTLPLGFRTTVAYGNIADSPFRREAIDGWKRRINSILSQGRMPIIDLQATYVEGKIPVQRIKKYMDEFGVAQTAFAAAYAPDSTPSLKLYRADPEYFIPITNSGEFSRWSDKPAAFLDVVRRDLESGSYFMMGEHEFRHYPSPEQVRKGRWDRDITVDIAGPAGQKLFALSAEFGVVFQIHYEVEDRLLAPLESVLAQHPKAKVIWCHLGQVRYPDRTRRYNADYVGSLIERFPGLHFDLAVARPGSIYKPSGAEHSTLYRDGRLGDDWKQLIEKHPERFLASSDLRPAVLDNYPAMIARQRELILDVLSERTRQLVGFGNAWRLITGASWSG